MAKLDFWINPILADREDSGRSGSAATPHIFVSKVAPEPLLQHNLIVLRPVTARRVPKIIHGAHSEPISERVARLSGGLAYDVNASEVEFVTS